VIASSDKRDIAQLEINLGKYPEVMYVLRSEKLLALDNLATDPTMRFVTAKDKSIIFNSMLVAPIRIGTQVWGVFSIRMGTIKERLSEQEIRFAQMAGNIAGLVAARDPAIAAPIANSSTDSEGTSAA
jgi:GAF domain-containing protein